MSVDTEIAVAPITEPMALDSMYLDYPASVMPPEAQPAMLDDMSVRSLEENEAVFAETWQRHRPMLMHVAGRIVGRDRAEDVFQATAVRAFTHLDSVSFPMDPEAAEAHCRAWLKRIAVNLSLDIVRRDARKKFFSLDETDPQTGMPYQERTDTTTHGAEEMTTGNAVVTRALQKLPPEFRQAFWAIEMEGLTYEQYALVSGVKLGTVRSRLHRARVMLRQMVSDGEIEGLEAPKH